MGRGARWEQGKATSGLPVRAPAGGWQALEVAHGVRWIRMPLGASLTHINLWAIEDGDRWAVVDSGLG